MSEVYTSIVNAFTLSRGHVLEIDILPVCFPLDQGSTSPVLQEGHSIAVRKDGLITAVVEARQRLFRQSQYASGRPSSSSQSIFDASLVLLLFDPEHLTAANARKRHLSKQSSELQHQSGALRDNIRAELSLLESVVTSPLHRHSKSPTLFSHRRWVVQTFHRLLYEEPDGEGADDATCNTRAAQTWQVFCHGEIDMVLRAAARHPKNYVAFSYLRWLLRFVTASVGLVLSHASCGHFMSGLMKDVADWCWKHPSDASGWSFLLFIMHHSHASPTSADLLGQSLTLASDFAWAHESFWHSIRTILVSDMALSTLHRKALVERIRALASTDACPLKIHDSYVLWSRTSPLAEAGKAREMHTASIE